MSYVAVQGHIIAIKIKTNIKEVIFSEDLNTFTFF